MSTRSGIGVINKDGSVEAIYCHNDGYETGVGITLLKHYKNIRLIRALLSLGGISSLHDTIEETAEEAYTARDEDLDIRKARSIEEYPCIIWEETYQEYQYFFREDLGKWFYASYSKERLTLNHLIDFEEYVSKKYGSPEFMIKNEISADLVYKLKSNVECSISTLKFIVNNIEKLQINFAETLEKINELKQNIDGDENE